MKILCNVGNGRFWTMYLGYPFFCARLFIQSIPQRTVILHLAKNETKRVPSVCTKFVERNLTYFVFVEQTKMSHSFKLCKNWTVVDIISIWDKNKVYSIRGLYPINEKNNLVYRIFRGSQSKADAYP